MPLSLIRGGLEGMARCLNLLNKILKAKTKEKELKYVGKKMKKGSEMSYKCVKMADYLLPNNRMVISPNCGIFAIRNKRVEIPEQFSSDKVKTFCLGGGREIMSHIYNCETLSEKENEEYSLKTSLVKM